MVSLWFRIHDVVRPIFRANCYITSQVGPADPCRFNGDYTGVYIDIWQAAYKIASAYTERVWDWHVWLVRALLPQKR